MNDDVPLVVPEVNAEVLQNFFNNDKRSNIISNPNCFHNSNGSSTKAHP